MSRRTLEDAEVHETHISRVFVTGDRAYKLKKPLVLPFLDYGTPARRREMCHEEVRLNRRLAPDIYLGVVGFSPDEILDEDDPRAVDYAVEMRRYDESRTLSARLARGEVLRAEIVAIGRVLARFHANAQRVAAVGTAWLAVERRMTENFHELLGIVDQRAEVEHVLALERFVHAFVAAHAGTLEARARQGHVREGHGDLRADHVLLDGDRIEIVDCVEFDPALRELDCGDDLAFLAMDLDARGAAHLVEPLIRAYRAAGGDPGDDALIAFYASYRALVRAKVALLRGAQHAAGSAERGRAGAEARDLLAVAERFAWRARLPLAIVFCGVPASGKSHVSRALATTSRLAHLSSDVTRKRLLGIAPDERAPSAAYSAAMSTRTYGELGRRARNEVAARGGAIVDATFRHAEDRRAFVAALGGAAPVVFVECVAPLAVLLRRSVDRLRDAHRISDATPEIVARERERWDELDEVHPEAHVTLRTDRAVDDLVADLKALLDRRLERLSAARRTTDGLDGLIPMCRVSRGGRF
jgi:uncharacterized protein